MDTIQERLYRVLESIQNAAAGRDNVKLIAVSKTKPAAVILEAFQAGQRLFGENKVQEARDKALILPPEINWHLIGPLQKNKAKYCPELFSTIHTLHRLDVAELLQKKCLETNRSLDVLIQMNLTGESSKSGVPNVDELRQLEDAILSLSQLRLVGLMTIGDPDATEATNQKHFATLYNLCQKEAMRLGLEGQMVELSTGMSSDYIAAIKEGATYVRIGSAIFGDRYYQ